jgi:uncharacterized membrane protein
MKTMLDPALPMMTASERRSFGWLAWIDRHARLLLGLMILLDVLVITVAAVRRLQMYDMGFDLALIQQVLWSTLHGRPFETYAYDFTRNLLGTDSFFVLLLFVPFYALAPQPATLFLVQAAIVASGAIPVYALAHDHLRRRWGALAFAAVYLAYLPVMWGSLYEIRERVLAMAFVLWMLLCIERRWYWRMLIPLALALSCRLDTTIGVALTGCYALLLRWRSMDGQADAASGERPRSYSGPMPWRFGLTLIAAAITWYLFVTQVMVPYFTPQRPGYLFLEHYGYLGKTPGQILLNVIGHPLNTLGILLAPNKLWYLLAMFLSLGFLTLLNWRALLIMLPLYGLNYLSPRKIQWDVYHHYQGLIVPFMIVGAIYGLASLVRRDLFGRRTLEWGIAAMFAGTLVSHAVYQNPLQRMFGRWSPTTREIAANTLAQRVPPEVPVAAGNLLAPHLAPRQKILLVPGDVFYYAKDPFAQAEYALVDIHRNDDERKATEQAIARGGWCTLDTQADYLLLKKQSQAHGERCITQ